MIEDLVWNEIGSNHRGLETLQEYNIILNIFCHWARFTHKQWYLVLPTDIRPNVASPHCRCDHHDLANLFAILLKFYTENN